MRTVRLSLAGTVVLALLVGPTSVAAQDEEVLASDEPHRVTGRALPNAPEAEGWWVEEPIWDEERQVERRVSHDVVTIVTDDPRLNGLLHGSINTDTYGGTRRAGLGSAFTTRSELVNDGGTWVGTIRGYVVNQYPPKLVSPRHEFWHVDLTGTGAYEGNTALLLVPGWYPEDYEIEGFVFPGALPEYPDAVEKPIE